jgi:hypothetical protein
MVPILIYLMLKIVWLSWIVLHYFYLTNLWSNWEVIFYVSRVLILCTTLNLEDQTLAADVLHFPRNCQSSVTEALALHCPPGQFFTHHVSWGRHGEIVRVVWEKINVMISLDFSCCNSDHTHFIYCRYPVRILTTAGMFEGFLWFSYVPQAS